MLSLSIFVFIAFLMVFLGGVVFVHDPRAKTHKFFLAGVIFWVAWMIANYLENVQGLSLPVREFFLRMDFACGPLANVFIALFVIHFVRREGKVPVWESLLAIVPGLFLAIVSFTKWHLPSVFLVPTGEINFEPGWTFPLYALIVILYFVVPVIQLLRFRHGTKSKMMRGQATSIAIGLALTGAVTLSVNLFLQNILPVEFFRLGIYAMVFFELGVTYSIIRHEFLNVRFVAMELLLMAILSTLLTRSILSQDNNDAIINIGSFVIMLVLGFAMIRSFLRELKQRLELQALSEKLETTNEHLKVANKKLKQLDTLKTEFLSIASHQLRTPLAVTKGYVAMLDDGMVGKVNKKQHAALENVRQSTESLILLVNHLLDLTRIESGRLQVKMEPVDVGGITRWVGDFLHAHSVEKGVTLTVEAPSSPVMVEADAEKLKEVVMNMTDNALKYTEKGSVKVRVTRTDGHVIVDVIDTGYGLSAEDKQHLFEKFSRGSASKFVKTSSGLGLYVCKKLMEGMGGTIEAISAGKGKGSTFKITLKAADKKAR